MLAEAVHTVSVSRETAYKRLGEHSVQFGRIEGPDVFSRRFQRVKRRIEVARHLVDVRLSLTEVILRISA